MFKRFTAGVAVGYVLGARAGQKRYDQITELADRALDVPVVERLVDTGRAMAMDQGRRVLEGLRERAQWNGGGDDGEAGDETDADVSDDDEVEFSDDPSGEDGDVAADEEYPDDEGFSDDEGFESDEDDVDDDVVDLDGEQDEDDEEDEDNESGGRSRGRIGSLASAARDRGRVA